MNKITNAERERIHSRAMEIVRLDIDGKVLDKNTTIGALMDEFSISQQRAGRHVAAAAQALRSVAARHAAVSPYVITAHKGGRTATFTMRATPALVEKIKTLALAWNCSQGDVVARLVEQQDEQAE